MLDIKFIRENKGAVKKAIEDKGVGLDLEKLLKLDEKRVDLAQEIEKLNAEKNKLNNEMKSVKPQGGHALGSAENKDEVIAKGKEVKEKLSKFDPEYKKVKQEYNELMLLVPNIPATDVPIGESDKDNEEISKWGNIPEFNFEIKDHVELGKSLDLIDLEKGVKTSGFRGYYLKNEAVYLHMAVMMHALAKMQENEFNMMIAPTVVRDFALTGSGHFPEGKEEIYQLANPGKDEKGTEMKDKFYLAGTSEPSLLAYYASRTFNEDELPIKACGFSQCYRSEIGSYGKDTKGLYRVHEFMKVEQIVICKADIKESDKWQNEMKEIAEEMLQDLKLSYRIVNACTGDMGTGKYRMYDIETWMPSRNSYGETHSDSSLTDWQARRLNMKYKDKDGNVKHVYTLNNTVIASPRILIAILENYQKKDGSVEVPKVLRKYMPGGIKIISPR